MLKLWLIKVLPFLGKYTDYAAACCGGCPQCATAAVTGITLDVIGSNKATTPEDSAPGADE